MRQYTKYSPVRSKRNLTKWIYPVLASLIIGALVWIWWQQRISPNNSSSFSRTNESDHAVSDQLRLRQSPLEERPILAPARTNFIPPRLETNLVQAPSLGTRTNSTPTGTNRPAIPTRTLATLPASLPPTNAVPETTNSIRVPKNILEVQVALERLAFSSGSIDGRFGPQTRAALRAFQDHEHLSPSGEPDVNTKALLPLTEPPLTTYTVSSNDLARLAPVGSTWLAKSQQERLDYETILELVAEQGHAHPGLIRSLNRNIDWTNVVADTAVTIPNVSRRPARSKAAFLRIRLAEKTLDVFDLGTNLLAHFPCSIAQRVEKRPVGQLLVEKLAPNPNYRFDPEVFPESAEARELGRVLMIPPGPNNPVGTAWIGLNRPGYGIHGTPRPEDVGRTESHGCFRLANWNAEYLIQLISVGTPVLVEP